MTVTKSLQGARVAATALALALSVGCGPGGGGGTPDGGPPITPTENPADLFVLAAVPVFDLQIAPADLQLMQTEASQYLDLIEAGDELQYVPAQLTFNGYDIGQVGVRYKGTYGTLALCFKDGVQTCNKLSIKIKFNEYAADRRFYGMKRVNLHSMSRDPSLMHERLAYSLFRDAGVVTSRAAHARVRVNGQDRGLYAMVEQIEGHLVKEAFAVQSAGNVYKEVWPDSADPAHYIAGLENNDAAPDVSQMVAFSAALAAAPAAERAAVLQQWMDGDYTLRFMAVLEALRYWDSIVAWYCGAWGCGNHNFYWYQEDRPEHTRFWLLPWDLDSTFGLATMHDHVPRWYEPPPDCTVRYPNGSDGTVTVRAPRCDPLIDGIAGLGWERFRTQLRALLDGPFQSDRLIAQIDTWAEQVAPVVRADPLYPSGEIGWRSELARLRRDIPLLRARLERLYSGTPVRPAGLSAAGVADFESVDALELAMVLQYYSASGTDLACGWNAEGPLAGAGDLRMDFEYRNSTAGPWTQWTSLVIPFEGHATVDMTAATELRMRVRTDEPRTVRIDLDSPRYLAVNEGIRFGWDVAATSTAQDVVLRLDDAALPTWARATGDDLPAVRREVTGLAIQPLCNGRGATGLLADGTSDPGFFQMDDVTFVRP